jgi:uncharacterized pyridoxamine 5'-phosphate oxidase family protein
MKTIKDCIDFANANPVCTLATVEGDRPRVRVLQFWYADPTGFYFQTGNTKDIAPHLRANPHAEACFYNNDVTMNAVVVRVAGRVEFLTDRAWKERVLEERPFLREMGMTAEGDALVIFRIPHGEALYWTMAENLKPKESIRF